MVHGHLGHAVRFGQHLGLPVGQVQVILILEVRRALLDAQGLVQLVFPFAVAHARAGVQVDAQHMGHAEEGVVARQGGGFIHADEAAAVIDKFCQLADQLFALPGVAAAPGVARAARVDHHVHPVQRAPLRVLKGNELHLHRQAGQGFVDVDEGVHVGFMEVAAEGPAA